LNHEIKAIFKANLSAEVPFGGIVFLDQLPKTSTGKMPTSALKGAQGWTVQAEM
jgi:acyl-coenzyme A synthetase/AMP-(fatty) acid ligase